MTKIKLLLVDDEEELVSTMADRLRWRGIEADAVTNGHAALERMQEQTYDILVVDLKMPGIDGLELREVVQRKHPDIKILMITGHGSSPHDEVVNIEAQEDMLLKPFDIDELVARIRQKLEQ